MAVGLLAVLVLVAGAWGAQDEDELAAKYPNRDKIGTNLGGNTDYSTQLPFADLMKQSRPWQLAPGQFLETVNAAGYPTAIGDVKPYATCLLGNYHPAGVYVLTWTGSAKLSVPKYDVVKVLKDEPGRMELEVKPEQGLYVQIDEMDPADPIRDIHLWIPDHEGKLFNEAFLEFVRPFGTLRFMDWTATNGSIQQAWPKRPGPDNCTWRLKESTGVPVEVMVQLCNDMRADGWFCMPHLADNNYVQQFASYVRDHLDPELKAYVEYSNEHWNWSFAVSKYCLNKGKEMGLVEGQGPHHAGYSKRAVEMFDIWHGVFGTETNRVVRTLGGRAASSRSNAMIVDGAGKGNADALAIAPYFGFNKEILSGKQEKMDSADKVLDVADKVIEEHVTRMVSDARKCADENGLRLIAYEAGQHLLARDERKGAGGPMTDLFIAANRTPRMGELYTKYLQTWFASGGEVICMFSSIGRPSKYGSWGMKETIGQPLDAAPKYKSVLNAIQDSGFIEE